MPPPAPHPLAAGRIGASAVVFVALAVAAPITVVTTTVPAAYTHGVHFVPLIFGLLTLTLLVYTVGYAAMARHAPNAGALYAFAARGLGRPTGVGTAGLAVLSYTAVQTGLYGATGAAAAPLLHSWFGVTAPWWAVAAGCWAVVTLCGLLRADVVTGLLALAVLSTTALIVGFGAANVLHPADGRIGWDTLVPAPVDRPALGLVLVLAAVAFIGFETAAAYAEEVIRPRRSIGPAAAVSVAVLGVLYAGSAWAMSVAAGPDRVRDMSAGRGTELMFDLAAARLAPWAVTLGRVLLLAGLLAALIALHLTLTRYTYALGRERLLPAALGRRVPASLTQSLVAAAALAASGGASWLARAGALGLLLVLLATSLSALLFLNRVPDGSGAWRRFAAPGAATVLLGVLSYLGFANLPALLDVPAGDPLVIAVPVTAAAVVLAGVAYGYAVKALDPVRYAGIGLGGTAVVVTPALPGPREPGRHRPERVRR